MLMDDNTQKNPPQTVPLSGEKYETFVLDKNHSLSRLLGRGVLRSDDPTLPRTTVTLLIRGIPEEITMTDDKPIILGRADLAAKGGFQPDIDLTPYGAKERGVSRIHARLHISERRVYISDLYSTNGTFVGGRKLEANDPYRLRNDDEILLGALVVKVSFS